MRGAPDGGDDLRQRANEGNAPLAQLDMDDVVERRSEDVADRPGDEDEGDLGVGQVVVSLEVRQDDADGGVEQAEDAEGEHGSGDLEDETP